MRLLCTIAAFSAAVLIAGSTIEAQPGGKKGGKGGKGGGETVDQFIAKLMAFNKAKDGKLTKDELTDKRLLPLFERADANKDGVVTREELSALYQREGGGGGGFGGDKGKGGFDGKGGFGKGKDGKGPDDKKGFKGFGGPGIVLPEFLQERMSLSADQRKQVADLQKEVDARLERILNDEQRRFLREIRERGPGFLGKKGPFGGDKKGDKKGPPRD